MNRGKWIKRSLLVVLLAIGSWFGLLLSVFVNDPAVAIQAYTTDAFPRIPPSLAGAYLRWASYDPNANVMGQPLLHFACANHSLVGTNRGNSILVVQMLAAKGADMDSRDNGMTALHEAILYSETDLVRALLDLGANPKLKIARPGKSIDGLSAVEYAEFLARKRPAEMRPVVELLGGAVPEVLETFGRGECIADFKPEAKLNTGDKCVVKLMAERCGSLDACFVKCFASGRGLNVGGGCYHLCNYSLWKPWALPGDWEKCYAPGERNHMG
jgi:hypothetical protein